MKLKRLSRIIRRGKKTYFVVFFSALKLYIDFKRKKHFFRVLKITLIKKTDGRHNYLQKFFFLLDNGHSFIFFFLVNLNNSCNGNWFS